MVVLLERSPAGRLAPATWAFEVVPTGMPLIGPDTRVAVSQETAGSDGSEHLAVGMSGPLVCCVATVAAATAANVAPPSGNTRCRPQKATCSPVALEELAGRGADPAPGAGRLVTGSVEWPDLVSSLAMSLPDVRFKAMPSEV
jgi:hypothetical protein